MVRAKFILNNYETSLQKRVLEGSRPDGKQRNWNDPVDTITEECRTLKLSAVYDNSEENKKFFHATPSGQISMGMLNPAAWQQFELGKEYYVDFTPAS